MREDLTTFINKILRILPFIFSYSYIDDDEKREAKVFFIHTYETMIFPPLLLLQLLLL